MDGRDYLVAAVLPHADEPTLLELLLQNEHTFGTQMRWLFYYCKAW